MQDKPLPEWCTSYNRTLSMSLLFPSHAGSCYCTWETVDDAPSPPSICVLAMHTVNKNGANGSRLHHSPAPDVMGIWISKWKPDLCRNVPSYTFYLKDKERGTDRFSICWFVLLITTMATAGLACCQKLLPGLSHGGRAAGLQAQFSTAFPGN